MWKFLDFGRAGRDQVQADKRMERSVPREILEAVGRIEIRARRLVEETFSGDYHSVFKGQGIEFREVREYSPGDDVRSIDWNVTARANAPFIKVFNEERELTVLLAADISRSGAFGSTGRTRQEIAAELCGVLAFCATANKDRVGLLLFSDQVELYIPPARGKSHVLRMIRELLSWQATGRGTDFNVALDLVGSVLKRKSTVFLVSDFWATGFDKALKIIGRRHDCIAVRLRDPLEYDASGLGLVNLNDAETGAEMVVDMSDRHTARTVRDNVAEHDRKLERLFRDANLDLIDVRLDKPYVNELKRFFERRESRRGRYSR
jgi:uncharacterized protein (DUF58 family)